MKRTGPEIVEQIREHARQHPVDSYRDIAAIFGVAEITVRRNCKGLGRSKAWRKGRIEPNPDSDDIWVRVEKTLDGCWTWTGSINNSGYGTVSWKGESALAHRVVWAITQGEVPAGLELDHLCKTRSCVRPDHLQPVTHRVNMERAGIIPASEPPRDKQKVADEAPSPRIDRPDLKPPESTEHRVVPLLNKNKINPANIDPPHSPVARSIPQDALTGRTWIPDLTTPFIAPLDAAERQRQRERSEDEAWGITPEKLGPSGKLSIFMMSVGPWFEGRYSQTELPGCVRSFAMFPARSEDDALEMFCSVWGPGYRYATRVCATGTHEYNGVSEWISIWRSLLKKSFERYQATPEGRALHSEVSSTYARESSEQIRRENFEYEYEIEVDIQAQLYEEELEAKRRKEQELQQAKRHRDGGDRLFIRFPDGQEHLYVRVKGRPGGRSAYARAAR